MLIRSDKRPADQILNVSIYDMEVQVGFADHLGFRNPVSSETENIINHLSRVPSTGQDNFNFSQEPHEKRNRLSCYLGSACVNTKAQNKLEVITIEHVWPLNNVQVGALLIVCIEREPYESSEKSNSVAASLV